MNYKKVFITYLLLVPASLLGQTTNKPRLHTPDEILKIMEESDLSYVIGEFVDSMLDIDSPIVHHNQLFLNQTAGNTTLEQYKLSEHALQLLDQGDKEFVKKNFEAALIHYQQLFSSQPDYSFALTMIGDAHYSMENYDSARIYFGRAIDGNFIDYSAHWFLADTYDKLGKLDSALKEITVAHLLNVNHAVLKSKMQEYRESASRPWQEWEFKPRFHLSKEANSVFINTIPEWIGYSMVKAVWKYEPGYAYKMASNEPDDQLINWSEEKEAIAALLTDSTKNQRVHEIITAGHFDEFILYELANKKYPVILLLLPGESFWRVFDYVEKYH